MTSSVFIVAKNGYPTGMENWDFYSWLPSHNVSTIQTGRVFFNGCFFVTVKAFTALMVLKDK